MSEVSPNDGGARLVLKGRRRSLRLRAIRESALLGSLVCCGLFTLLVTFSIVGILIMESVSFFRLDEARSPDTGGTGLGLTIARDVVRGHGGDVLLEDAPGGGLRVRVRLPL